MSHGTWHQVKGRCNAPRCPCWAFVAALRALIDRRLPSRPWPCDQRRRQAETEWRSQLTVSASGCGGGRAAYACLKRSVSVAVPEMSTNTTTLRFHPPREQPRSCWILILKVSTKFATWLSRRDLGTVHSAGVMQVDRLLAPLSVLLTFCACFGSRNPGAGIDLVPLGVGSTIPGMQVLLLRLKDCLAFFDSSLKSFGKTSLPSGCWLRCAFVWSTEKTLEMLNCLVLPAP